MKRHEILYKVNKLLLVVCLGAIITGVVSSMLSLWGVIEDKELSGQMILSSVVFFFGAICGLASIGCFKSNSYDLEPPDEENHG